MHVYVSGDVQGVGFRYAAVQQAEYLGVAGWVKNLPDGSVELWLEGTETDVQAMVAWCQHGPRGAWVSEIRCEPDVSSGQFRRFRVHF